MNMQNPNKTKKGATPGVSIPDMVLSPVSCG